MSALGHLIATRAMQDKHFSCLNDLIKVNAASNSICDSLDLVVGAFNGKMDELLHC